MLYIIPTPIGNLSDLSPRILEAINLCDEIFCEDTRSTRNLFHALDLHKPLSSYHAHNESQKMNYVLGKLQSGLTIGLVSDAGMPGLCDPGEGLIEAALTEGIPFTVLPGPSSLAVAISAFGEKTYPLHFDGFLPKKSVASFLDDRRFQLGTHFFFATKRQLDSFFDWADTHNLRVFVAKEISKKFETFCKGSPDELKEKLMPYQGEYVIGFEVAKSYEIKQPISIQAAFELLTKSHDLHSKDALKILSDLYQIPRKTLYKQLLI